MKKLLMLLCLIGSQDLWAQDAALYNNNWQILRLEEGKTNTLVENQGLVLSFREQGSFGLKLDINRCKGKFEVEEKRRRSYLLFDPLLSCTKRCCDSPESSKIAQALQGKWEISRIDNEGLQLSGPNKMQLYCQKAPEDIEQRKEINVSLPGTAWQIVQALDLENDGLEFKFSDPNRRVVVEFREESIELVMPKQSCSIQYSIEGDSLRMPERQAVCQGPCCDTDIDRSLMQEFASTVHYRFQGNQLIIKGREKELFLELMPK